MSDINDDHTKLIKKYLDESGDNYNPEHSLNNALKAAKMRSASRDIFTLFTGWVWVIFVGFGASIYTEIHKHSPNKNVSYKNTKSNHTKIK